MWNHFYIEMQDFWQRLNNCFLKNMDAFLSRDVTRFLAQRKLLFSEEMWNHFYIGMLPDFWPRLHNCFSKKCGYISL